jgi:hypothetical protein
MTTTETPSSTTSTIDKKKQNKLFNKLNENKNI